VVRAGRARRDGDAIACREDDMATNTATARKVQGREVPPPGRWAIDPSHSAVQFVARHMMISKVRGHFREFSGTVHIDEVPERSWVEATINAASIDTGDADRDAHLRAADFLDVERFPEIRYRSTSVRAAGEKWEVTGDLTLRDVTRPAPLVVEFCGVASDPWGNMRAGFLGTTEINREDFSVTWNQVLESGGFLVGKGVKIEVDVEAVLESDA
jgi:polyisoprenoid-binding protein YceI